ncbi:MAG: PQQ-binding-like beta-propeller repeat protein [Armatimonadota bacterium]|nr:PQQ-binding-like beta-propeller repeat protein [Armatimonadota bacterium]
MDCRIEKQIKFPRAGRSGVEPPHSKSRRRWTFQAGDKITAEPLVHGDRVYVGSWDERMYALDVATGERIWEFRTGNAVVAGAVVTGEKLVFGSHDGNVYALDLGSGKELWRRPMGSSEDVLLTPNGPWVECSPVAGEYKPGFPERLFVGSHHRRLAALNPETGVVCWEFPTFNWILGRPVVADYTVYFGCIDGWLYAVDAMCGALRWRYRVGEKLRYAPTVIPGSVRTKAITAGPLIHEGVIYIGAHDGFMHAVDRATGRAIWTREVGRVLPSKAVLRGNRLVAVTNDGLIVALEARSGRLDWRRDLRVTVHADLVPHDADSFWIAPVEGWMLRIGAAGGLVDNALAGGPVRATPCVTREGDLVVATCRGEIARIPTKGGGR